MSGRAGMDMVLSAASGIPETPDNQDAPAAIRALYRDIRAVMGTQVVNAVYRRVAALGPEALAQVWSRLRPIYLDGRLDGLAARLGGPHLSLDTPADRDLRTIAANAALSKTDRRTIQAIIESYDINNRRNLIAFIALLDAQSRAPEETATQDIGVDEPPGRLGTPLPPLPSPGELDEPACAVLLRLNRYGDAGASPAMASLYRHLAWWPGFLEAVDGVLHHAHMSGALHRAVARTGAESSSLAGELPRLAVAEDLRVRLIPILGPLTERAIPKMIPIGRLLLAIVSSPVFLTSEQRKGST